MSATLLLNADGSPVSMLPLSTLTWKESIMYLVLEKGTVLEWHENWIVRSANWATKVPAVIILKQFEKRKTQVRFSKKNVFLRDAYTCQYCNTFLSKRQATVDHVIPTSRGGKSTYENTVCACVDCNARKGNDTRMKPIRKPIKPSYYQLVEQQKKMPVDVHPSWLLYLNN